jgi:flavodoxin
MSRTAIVYYSLTGNTKHAAKVLAEQIDATLVQLEDEASRRGLIGFLRSGLEARLERPAELIGNPWEEVEACDTVYLMTPLWASRATPAMNAFIQHADLAGKSVRIVTFQADPKVTGSSAAIATLSNRVEARGGRVDETYALHSAPPGRYAGDSHLSDQITRLR